MLNGPSWCGRVVALVAFTMASETWAGESMTVEVAAATLARGADLAWVADRKTKIKRSLVSSSKAFGVTVAPGGTTYWVDVEREGQRGAMLISRQLPRGRFFVAEATDATFSPDSELLAFLDYGSREARVLSTSTGDVVATYSETRLVRFRPDGRLQYRTDCQLFEVDLIQPHASKPVGPHLCGEAAAAVDGSGWIVAQRLSEETSNSANYFSNLTRIDGATGQAVPLPTPSMFHSPQLSRDGRRCCFGVMAELFCLDLSTGQTDHLVGIGPEQLDWEQDDQVMLGVSGEDLVMVDFPQRSIRKVARLGGHRSFHFLPGGTRIYMHGEGASLLDLQAGTRMEIHGRSTTVSGFGPVPGHGDLFTTSVESKGKTGVYWIEVLSAAPKRLPAIRK